MSVKRSFLDSVLKKLRFWSGIMQGVIVSIFRWQKSKMTILRTNSVAYLSQPKLVPKVNFRGDFCFFLTTDHRYALASPHWSFLRKLGHREQKNRKCRWAEKILGVEYRSASNSGTHRDNCFVGWNCAFLTKRPHGRHVFPTTFWAKQETWDALPLIFVFSRQIDVCQKHFTHRAPWTQ